MDHVPGQALPGLMIVRGNGLALIYGKARMTPRKQDLDQARGKLEEALKDLELVARQSPDFEQVHVQLASVYQRLNRKEDSRREREIVLKLHAKEREAKIKPEP
jgi:Flp pilus assembly protein TadD